MELSRHWGLDPDTIFLNHGSFGACPTAVLEYQRELQDRIERQPVQFYVRDFETMLDSSRTVLAAFLDADPLDVAWVPNATTGINAVLRSMRFAPGDELIVTNHEYGACRNTLDFVAERDGARVVVVDIPFPIVGPAVVTDAIMSRVSSRTRLALLDHVTSQTGLVMPLEDLVPLLKARGVATLIDGAHAPGMIDLSISRLDPDYYSGNCHKWICAPKGCGFLYVRRELQQQIRPVTISHGARTRRTDRSKFLIEFDWPGTWDTTPALCVSRALTVMEDMLPGGWPATRAANRDKALGGRRVLCDALGTEPPCPDTMIGSLAALPIPDAPADAAQSMSDLYGDPLQDTLLQKWHIEVPIVPWPAHPKRLIRISAQLYNNSDDYLQLASALRELFP
ncbi:MAG: aminotransferase class V-fold PLP-dependent enzyme [Gammaproteobacteria bacterium]|nr:aminotransferase class V-fold PLP-dependent enzyme [Gammaproteobacteria bacterium]